MFDWLRSFRPHTSAVQNRRKKQRHRPGRGRSVLSLASAIEKLEDRTLLSGNPFVAGDYEFNGQSTRIDQSGDTLVFTNENGNQSTGSMVSPGHVRAGANWGHLTGTLIGNNIQWANGASWALVNSDAPDISGPYNSNGQGATVDQQGYRLTFTNEHGGSSSGFFLNPTQVQASEWGNLVGNIVNGNIEWQNGSVWNDSSNPGGNFPNLDGDYTNLNGQPTRIQQQGSALTIFDENGQASPGTFVSETEISADNWGWTGDIVNGEIQWSTGDVWTEDVAPQLPDLSGSYLFNGQPTHIAQNGTTLVFTNEHGSSSSGSFVDQSYEQVIAHQWGGLVGTIVDGDIHWSNGGEWVKDEIPEIGGEYSFNGQMTQVTQNGESLTFFNENGDSSSGEFLNSREVIAHQWGGLVGDLIDGNIHWRNNAVWTRSTFGDLELTAITSSVGFPIEEGDVRTQVPAELTFEFSDQHALNAATLNGIRIVRSVNGVFGDGDDAVIAPAFLGIGSQPNVARFLFAEVLPDDLYRITIAGSGSQPLRNTFGTPFNGGVDLVRTFEIKAEAQVVSVDPQPLSVVDGQLTQNPNIIRIQFSGSELDPATAQSPQFYQLVDTKGTVDDSDDTIKTPKTVVYDSTTNIALVEFDEIPAGDYIIRVGADELNHGSPVQFSPADDENSSLTSADILNDVGGPGVLVTSQIDTAAVTPAASTGQTVHFNFASTYGTDPQGNSLYNLITSQQKERVREVFEALGFYLGVDFVETADQGITIASGDLRAIDVALNDGPGGAISGSDGGTDGRVVIDVSEPLDSASGGAWFQAALEEIDTLLQDAGFDTSPADPFLDGTHSLAMLRRAGADDVDLYTFSIFEEGTLTADLFAQQLGSGLNAGLTLFHFNGSELATVDAQTGDPSLEFPISPGVYFLGVSADDTTYDKSVANSGTGGTTTGNYELLVKFTPDIETLNQTDGTPYDADADGNPGGVFEYAFIAFPQIGGEYEYNGQPRVQQFGSNLTFVNENGAVSAGRFLSRNRVEATGWNTTGTVHEYGITWASGRTWLNDAGQQQQNGGGGGGGAGGGAGGVLNQGAGQFVQGPPQLVQVLPNVGAPIVNGTVRNVAPNELLIQFDQGQAIDPNSLGGIVIVRAGLDGQFGTADDVQIMPGWAGIGDFRNEVIIRFAEALPDDDYQLIIQGSGATPLVNIFGTAFNDGNDLTIDFTLDLGAQVLAVNPQPVLREQMVEVSDASLVADGDTISVTVGGTTVVFELEDAQAGDGLNDTNNTQVDFDSANIVDPEIAIAGALRTAIDNAFNTVATIGGAGAEITINGASFTPVVVVNAADPTAFSANEGSLTQSVNEIVIHFNEDDLDPVSAIDPRFYQLINTKQTLDGSDDDAFLPTEVVYDPVNNTATLRFVGIPGFENGIPDGTYRLRVGVADSPVHDIDVFDANAENWRLAFTSYVPAFFHGPPTGPSGKPIQYNTGGVPNTAAALILGTEQEAPGSSGANDTSATAEFITGFGTDQALEDNSVDISGNIAPAATPIAIGSFAEDDGSIPLANTTALTSGNAVRIDGTIGDGPFGSPFLATGDFDFFEITNVQAGDVITVDSDTVLPFGPLDTTVAIWDAAGNLVAYNDDQDVTVSFDSYIEFFAPTAGDYYVSIHGFAGGFPFDLPLDPFFSDSGLGAGSEGDYTLTIGLNAIDVDYYSVDLEAGDIFGANVFGAGQQLNFFDPNGNELIGSHSDNTGIHPTVSPLPGGGNAALSYVVPAAGTYTIAVTGHNFDGAYDAQLRVFRPDLELQPEGAIQTIFLDFDGATVDRSIFGGQGVATLSGIDEFLDDWKVNSSDPGQHAINRDLVIDAIIDTFTENLLDDIRTQGNNGDFSVSNNPGDFGIQILNSRDHADPFGQTNVSRVIIGGTNAELGLGFTTIGIAERIDVGNFETEETAVVLLDLLSAPFGNPASLNSVELATDPEIDISDMIDLIGVGVGNIASHEAGHLFAAWHTDITNANPAIMDGGFDANNTLGLGLDNIFGTGDDVDVDFGSDVFANSVIRVPRGFQGNFTGTQDALNAIAFGLSTGTSEFNDDNSSFETASELNILGDRELVINSRIQAQNIALPPLAGGIDEPGHRDIPNEVEAHFNSFGTTPEVPDAITTFAYNFKDVYGLDLQGNDLFNAIEDVHKQRVREIFEILGYYLGFEAVETADTGLTIAYGDLRAVIPPIPPLTPVPADPADGFDGLTGFNAFGDQIVVLDKAEESTLTTEYGGQWFRTAMHLVGNALGLGDSFDIPSIQGDDITGEPVFPGDHDLTHYRRLFRPDASDIDLYEFIISDDITTGAPNGGTFTAEIFAERLADTSLLNSALTLFDADGNVLARNDDYYSNDSFIEFHLDGPGTYFIGVTSTGNLDYDPHVSDTGSGGRTDGDYELRLNFVRDPLDGEVLVDETGTAFDGDADGKPGGVFEFFFQATAETNTLFVDKANPIGDGTLADPFNQIDQAIAAANSLNTDGDANNDIQIIRIIGNGGADNDLSTPEDVNPYLIGLDPSFNALPDGRTFNVPQGVTVMIDQGAVIKLENQVIDVGSSPNLIDRSGAALQILGTPDNHVTLTSNLNETIGGDTDGSPTNSAAPGDWGGIVYRADSDLEEEGIFLNVVNLADIDFAGGSVAIDTVAVGINPIHVFEARPRISYNTITNSAGAAMSADPNSFDDYIVGNRDITLQRIGPDIVGNMLTGNSLNGLNIRIETLFGEPIDKLDVTGRFDDEDITHILTENLHIVGNAGGAILNGSTLESRESGRLRIDPNIVLKVGSARIEAELGNSNFIAEGNEGEDIIFTSIFDDRFGRGGTFDATNNLDDEVAAAGDWGGVILNATSGGSIDQSFFAFGGGLIPIEGAFDTFNVIEIHQADARITNSRFETNAAGETSGNRSGRGANDATTIFVRGAQPVVTGNEFVENLGSVLSINVNALNSDIVRDLGRSTGGIDVIADELTGELLFSDNHGPLIAGNVTDDNGLNAIDVRASYTVDGVTRPEVVTVESIWDDADIVHVVRDEIIVPNFHTFTGIRLESSPRESLVVKLDGLDAGFTAAGNGLDIDDRIGGIVQIVGQPLRPVILTSLTDDSVPAGRRLDGQPQFDTDNDLLPDRSLPPGSFNIEFNFGPNISADPAAMAAFEEAARIWESIIEDPVTVVIDAEIENLGPGVLGGALPQLVTLDFDTVIAAMKNDARLHESIVQELPDFANFLADLPDNTFSIDGSMLLTRANAMALGFDPATLPTIPSQYDPADLLDVDIVFADTPGLFDFDRSDGIGAGQFDFVGTALHEIGHGLGFISAVDDVDFALFDPAFPRNIQANTMDMFRLEPGEGTLDFPNVARDFIPQNDHVFYDGGIFNIPGIPIAGLRAGDIPMSTGTIFGDGNQASHLKDDLLIAGINLGMMDPTGTPGMIDVITPTDLRIFDLIGWDAVAAPSTGMPGDWRSVQLQEFSHDRNVQVMNELEGALLQGTDANRDPLNAQFLGDLAPDVKSGDENRRLGFTIDGSIARDDRDDQDVYSFRAETGTEVWFDIDRTDPTLNSVVELINPNGVVLASASDNFTFTGLAQSMTANVNVGGDYYTSNPNDAGMRVVLPGPLGQTNTYYVRVRSADTIDDNVDAGSTTGTYQLQLRLQQRDEIAGSAISAADIRFATNGIEVFGLPGHSPLISETTEVGDATSTSAGAQDVGNLLDSDRNSIGIAGSLNGSNSDVDFFSFTIDYEDVQGFGNPDGFEVTGERTFPIVFDIDYADGLARPDTTISVFDSTGTLIYVGRESNVEDDQPAPGEGADFDDISRGTVGKLDPFIGTIQLPAGITSHNISAQYFVAVSSNTEVPVQLNATFLGAGATNPLIRLEPVNSLQRIAEDHIGSQGYSGNGVGITPTTQLFDVFDNITIDTHVTPFTLQDLTLFSAAGSFLFTADPQFGGAETFIGTIREPAVPGNPARAMSDIVMRSDGRLIGISGNRVLEIDSGGNPGGGTTSTLLSLTNIPSSSPSINQAGLPINGPRIAALRAAMNHTTIRPDIQAMTFERTGFNINLDVPVYSVAHMVTETGRSDDGVLRTFQQLYRGDGNGSAPTGFEGYLTDPNVALTIAEDFQVRVDTGGNAAGILMQAVVPGGRGNGIDLVVGTTLGGTRAFISGAGEVTVLLQVDNQGNSNVTIQQMVDVINASAGNQYIKVGWIGTGGTNALQAMGVGTQMTTAGGVGDPIFDLDRHLTGVSYGDFFGGTEMFGVNRAGEIGVFPDTGNGPGGNSPFIDMAIPFLVTNPVNGGIPVGPITANWVPAGPQGVTGGEVDNITNSPVAGAISAVATHPTDPNIVYIGAANGGVWRTTNATAASPTWSPLTDAEESLSISSIAFDPTDFTNNTVLAGIGNTSNFGEAGPLTGVLRSTDNGGTWTLLDGGGTLDGKNISAVAGRGSTIVVAVESATTGTPGIYRSTDDGATFTQVSNGDGILTGLPRGATFDLVGDPFDSAILYTGVSGADVGAPAGVNGIYKSIDGGASWALQTDPVLDALIVSGLTNNILLSVGTNNNVYAGVVNGGALAGLFRSGDGGTTWTQLDTPPDLHFNGEGDIQFSLVADPNDDNVVYVGGDSQPDPFPNAEGASNPTGRLFRVDASLAAGTQASSITHNGTANGSAPHDGSRDMAVDALGHLIQVDSGGVYRQTSPQDANGVWVSLIGNLQVTEFHDIAYDNNFDFIVGGSQDIGVVEQENAGDLTWRTIPSSINLNGDGGDVAIDDSQANQTFVYTSGAFLTDFVRRQYDSNGLLVEDSLNDAFIRMIGAHNEVEPNDTLGSAQNLDLLQFSLNADPNITDGAGVNTSTTIPHLSIRGSGNNTVDLYSFTVANAGDRAIFDIDASNGFDAWLNLRDNTGTIIDFDDDQFPTDPGSGTGLDSLLDHTFAAPGTYFIEVGAFPNGQPIPNGAGYTLHVSVENHPVGVGDPPVGDAQRVTPIVVNAVNGNRLIVGGVQQIYESTNQGSSFNVLSAVTGANPDAIAYGGRSGGVDNPNVLYVGGGTEIFARTTAGPITPRGFIGGFVRDIVLDPEEFNTAYVIDSNNVFVTTNTGGNWTDISGNLPITDLRSIEYIEAATSDYIVVGGGSDVYVMDVAKEGVWNQLGVNLPHASVHDMEYDAVDDVLVVGTLGRGSFILEDVSTIIDGAVVPAFFGADIAFTSAALGPQNMYDGAYRNTIFALAEDGGLVAFEAIDQDGFISFDTPLQNLFEEDAGLGTYFGFNEVEPNDTDPFAMNLDDLQFLNHFDANITDEAGNDISIPMPHLTIHGTGNNTVDVYSFAGTTGTRAVFDIDFGDGIGDGGDFDSFLTLRDSTGAVVATDDDLFFTTDPGSATDTDALLDVILPADDTYFLEVSSFDGSLPVPIGATYQLHVSIEGKPRGDLSDQAPIILIGQSGPPVVEATGSRPGVSGTSLIVSNDDTLTFDNGDANGFESRIEWTLDAGTYYVVVGAFDSQANAGNTDVVGARPTFGDTYTLHVSVENHATGIVGGSFPEVEANDWFGIAQDLDDLDFTTNFNPNIANSTTIPHVTINGEGDDSFDYYVFTVSTDDSQVIIDIDNASPFFDSEIFLFDVSPVDPFDFILQTDAAGSEAIAFSPLDFNLWHPTERRVGQAGHGINDAPDNSRSAAELEISNTVDARLNSQGSGNVSFYFGFEEFANIVGPDPEDRYLTYEVDDFGFLINSQLGVQDSAFQLDLSANPAISDNYNLPGGAMGSLTSNSFDLSAYHSTDRPTLYFNYFLETQNTNSLLGGMRDSARVFVSTDGGETYHILASNNSVRSVGIGVEELPSYFTHSASENTNPALDNGLERSQELYDNTGGWRQARVDLSEFAGEADLMLRFDFTTAGQFDDPAVPRELNLPGDVNGNFNSAQRGQNNQSEGFYIDDIIIGFAERGEMVTAAQAGQTSFVGTPPPTSATAGNEYLAGPYQLEIRRATEYGISPSVTSPAINLTQLFDTNDRHVITEDPNMIGDDNLIREQGQLLIAGNQISNVLNYGLFIDAGARDAGSNLSHPGSSRVLPALNQDNLATSVYVENNVISNFGDGGIFFGGDTAAGPQAVLPFGKFVNNTIYGGDTPNGIGIEVGPNASPTMINNIIANTDTSIEIDPSSAPGVTGTAFGFNVFQNNNNNPNIVPQDIQLLPTSPLFVDPTNGNFYLAAGSRAIDSSLDRLAERPTFAAVKSPMGIPPSDIFAPNFDIFGQFREDDPGAAPPPGLGFNVFKDRGAIERNDTLGPEALLIVPLDGGPNDTNPNPTEVALTANFPTDFVIQLLDGQGVGVNDSKVNSGQFTLSRGGTILVAGIDYLFIYDPNTDQVTFRSTTGPWGEGQYAIDVDNSQATGVVDNAENPLQPNRPDGTTAFTIRLGTVINVDPDGPGGPGGPGGSGNDIQVIEGDAGLTVVPYTVSLSEASTATISADIGLFDGTATVLDNDYLIDIVDAVTQLPVTSITFLPGETEVNLEVRIVGDINLEPDEDFFVTLSNPVNAGIADATSTITILNDDPPSVSLDDETSVVEGDIGAANFMVFTVTLSDPTTDAITVDYATSDGTATAGVDYTPRNGTLVFSVGGAMTQHVLVPVIGDFLDEGNEDFFLNLSNASNANIIGGTGRGEIFDEPTDTQQPLQAVSIEEDGSASSLQQGQLDAVVEAALARWEAFAPGAIGNVTVGIADLASNQLGAAHGSTVLIDVNAAGNGWFVDSTADDNAEYTFDATSGQFVAHVGDAAGGIDLLTVLLHELGHVAGLNDVDAATNPGHIMADTLGRGVRRGLGFTNVGNDGAFAPLPSFNAGRPLPYGEIEFTVNNSDTDLSAVVDQTYNDILNTAASLTLTNRGNDASPSDLWSDQEVWAEREVQQYDPSLDDLWSNPNALDELLSGI